MQNILKSESNCKNLYVEGTDSWYYIFFHEQKGLGYSFTFMYHFLEMGQGREQSFLKQGKKNKKPN